MSKNCPLCGAELLGDAFCPITISGGKVSHYYRSNAMETCIVPPYYAMILHYANRSLISYWNSGELLLQTDAIISVLDEQQMRDKIKLLLTFS